MTISKWYEKVNQTWPKDIPTLTAEEAVRAGRKLYRYGMRRTFRGPVRVTSGNRYTWIRRGEMVVNPQHGWPGLIHLISHYCHRRLHPGEKPHSKTHARLELRMVKEVVKRGWLNGNIRAKVEEVAKRVAMQKAVQNTAMFKLERLKAREKQWQTKSKRASTALKKLNREIRITERRING